MMDEVRVRRPLRRQRSFRRLMAGHVLAVAADTSVYIVFPVWAKDITGSMISAGLVFSAFVIPSLLGPLAGNAIDRYPRQKVIAVTNLAMAVAVLGLLMVGPASGLLPVIAVSMIYGLGYVVFTSARSGLIFTLFSAEELGPVNAAVRTSREVLRVAAPVSGAAIYLAFGPRFFAVTVALSLLLSAWLFATMKPGTRPQEVDREAVFGLRGLVGGLVHIWRQATLRVSILLLSATLLVAGFYEVVLLSILDALDRPAVYFGYLVTAQGIGAVLGGLLVSWLIRKVAAVRLIGVGFAVQGIGVCGLFVEDLGVVLISCFVFGFGLPATMVGLDTIIQLGTPEVLQGRASAAVEAVTSVPFAASFITSALLLEILRYPTLVVVMALVTGLSALPFFFIKPEDAHGLHGEGRDGIKNQGKHSGGARRVTVGAG